MNRVLVLCEYASLNGGERSLLAVLDGVRQAGFVLTVAAPGDGPLAAAVREHGVGFLPLELHDPQGRRVDLAVCRERVRAVIAASGADLVHANSVAMSRVAGPVVAELGAPSLGHLRDMLNVNARVIADLNCHRRLLAVSDATRAWFVARGVASDKTHTLHNGVDLAAFCSRPRTGWLHRELGLSDNVLLVGTIGQIGPRKGLDTLWQAAIHVVRVNPDAHFVIVGQRYSQKQESREYEARLRQAAASEPLCGRLHLLGVRDDVPRLLNEFAVLAHAARQEPLGRVLLEAAASGTPVIATDVGGTREVFPDDTASAVLVPPDDAPALAAALLALLPDAPRRDRLSQSARRRAASAFDARQTAAALAAHYRALAPHSVT